MRVNNDFRYRACLTNWYRFLSCIHRMLESRDPHGYNLGSREKKCVCKAAAKNSISAIEHSIINYKQILCAKALRPATKIILIPRPRLRCWPCCATWNATSIKWISRNWGLLLFESLRASQPIPSLTFFKTVGRSTCVWKLASFCWTARLLKVVEAKTHVLFFLTFFFNVNSLIRIQFRHWERGARLFMIPSFLAAQTADCAIFLENFCIFGFIYCTMLTVSGTYIHLKLWEKGRGKGELN